MCCAIGRFNSLRSNRDNENKNVIHLLVISNCCFCDSRPLFLLLHTVTTSVTRCVCERASEYTVKPVLFAWPLLREFRDLGDFAKVTGREYADVADD